MTAITVLAAWCAASVPVALLAGRYLRGRGHDPQRCRFCRPDLEADE